VKEIRLIL